jgi:putative nucleotidyltransferase with HDIG domain
MDGDRRFDGLDSGRAHVAELLDERRARVASEIVERLQRYDDIAASPLVARTLVHALTRSLAASEPEILVHWARMVREAHAGPVVVAMIETACEIAEEVAHAQHGDLATTVIFLEIVKARASAHALHDSAGVVGEPAADSAIESLLAMLRARDDATCTHSHATGAFSRRIALRMGLSADVTERVAKAGVLHDVGKIRIPDTILFKPGPLDEAEWRIMRRHAEAGAEILMQIPALAQYAPIVAAHHERCDGRGYPLGLCGDEIALEARIVSVADSFHAMTTERVYREPLSYGEAIVALGEGRGKQWDADVTDVMIALAAEDRNSTADANLAAMTAPFFADPLRARDGSRAM